MATPEASAGQEGQYLDYTPTAAKESGDIVQVQDGRAGFCISDIAANIMGAVEVTRGRIVECDKAASVVILEGAPCWWDHSANGATPVPPLVAGDKDFYLGVAQADAAATASKVKIAINELPRYEIDFLQNGGDTAIVKTAGTPYAYNRGASLELAFSETAEAQKVDWISKRSFPVTTNWILEAVVEVVTNADADVADLDVGVANATHASDFEAITEFAAFHFDMGADLNLDAHSDDGTTDVPPTDTTDDWAVGTPIHLVIDGRDQTDMHFYVNGIERLAATAFPLTAATGPLKAIVLLEKTANDSPGIVQVDMLRVRFTGNE